MTAPPRSLRPLTRAGTHLEPDDPAAKGSRRSMSLLRTLSMSLAPVLLSACVSVGIGGDVPAQAQYRINDPGAAALPRRGEAIVEALLIQPVPGDALADTTSITYSPRPNEFAFYQLARWSERPVRRLPRLLKERLEARGVAEAIGLLGDPIKADWLLTFEIDALYHDVSGNPGQVRVGLTAELIDRRTRTRVGRRQFATVVEAPQENAAGASTAASKAVALTFDALVPWLEAELLSAATSAH